MVLCLPILLLVMALMINFGTVASWKIRADAVSHYATWGSRSRRSLGPRPEYWPDSASMANGGASGLDLMETWASHPVMRGPELVHSVLDGGMTATTVNSEIFDPERGPRAGTADLERALPLLTTLGNYHLHARDALLSNQWQFSETGLGGNSHRRVQIMYDLSDPSLETPFARLVEAREENLALLLRDERLHPLDQDHEWNEYHARFPLVIGTAPDLYPRLRRFCSLSHETAAERVEDLVDRIQGRQAEEDQVPSVAERAASQFRNMYQRVIDELEALLDLGTAPPGAQAEIDRLQRKIDTLTQFITSQQSGN